MGKKNKERKEQDMETYLSAKDVASLLNISIRYVYLLIGKDLIPTVRHRRVVKVRAKDLAEYIEALDRTDS